ncbi:putative E3 ubiquitin-protein ligase UBR1 [Plasmopara halstedii]
MVKIGDAEQQQRAVVLDVAASLARSTAIKTQSSSSDVSVILSDADKALEEQLMAHFHTHSNIQDEARLISAFLAASLTSKRLLTQKLLATTEVSRFPDLLQFFLRVIIAVHGRTHEQHPIREQPELQTCSYTQIKAISCISYEQEESSTGSTSMSVRFKLPEGFHACIAANYGSVKRLKCEEVWHGDHMAYRCRTCGLSDSSCMCLACFDPEEHEGHDYRVYRCSSGGCCDCGDPLAWKPEGFCKKHSVQHNTMSHNEFDSQIMTMGSEEDAVMHLLVRCVMAFCVDVLNEVYLVCLKLHANGNPEALDSRRSMPRTGLARSSFSSIVNTQVDRLEHTLSWLQMLSMSCLSYRTMISNLFFEELSSEWKLDVVSPSRSSGRLVVETNQEIDEREQTFAPLVTLDVFLKAGVLLPVEACDVLGVLYLKLLFDQSFKQKYTCYFVDWYPYLIELYLCASDENNEEGMRSLSRFIDRLFCQLFHSNAQLRELETVFASMRPRGNTKQANGTYLSRQRHSVGFAPGSTDAMPSSCVEWLMVFLLEKLNDLFRSTLRLVTIMPQPLVDATRSVINECDESSMSRGRKSLLEVPLVARTVQAIDCGRNVFKKRVYARLCSDLRTLLVHPQIAAEVLLRSFGCIRHNNVVLNETSVYEQLLKTFALLQQMDLQTRQIHRHIEFESQNWTFAFVADYEVKLLLSAFLTGIPACFSPNVWRTMTEYGKFANEGTITGITGNPLLNPMKSETFRPLALARAILLPVRTALTHWLNHNRRSEFGLEATKSAAGLYVPGEVVKEKNMAQLVKQHEQGIPGGRIAGTSSLHFPLHHMYAALIQSMCGVVRPKTIGEWRELLGMGTSDDGEFKDSVFWFSVLDHPLRVLFFSREIKAGLWVRNGAVMLQQLIHYHSKHWRFFGLHSDLFLCQLGAIFLPHGAFIRRFFHQLPFGIRESSVLVLKSASDAKTDSGGNDVANTANCSQGVRQELDVVEEALRLLLQLVFAPVRLTLASSSKRAAVWLLEREIMHWLALGPFTRSEVLMRTDMRLVEHIKQLSTLDWAELEEEEILTHVLDTVGVHDDPVGSSSGPRTARSGSSTNFGLRMSGSWKLKPELWAQISPLFECYTPSEAQQCEQNIRNHIGRTMVVPILSWPKNHGFDGVDMHELLAETMLNSSYLASVLFIIIGNYVRHRDNLSTNSLATNENLLLAALHCLYVAVELSPADSQNVPIEVQRRLNDTENNRTLDDIASYYEENSNFFCKLVTEIPMKECEQSHDAFDGKMTTASLLSLLVRLSDRNDAFEDIQPTIKLVFEAVEKKSMACLHYLNANKRRQLKSQATSVKSMKENINVISCGNSGNNETSGDDLNLTAKELMRRRQQQILEKLRSQQMQFLQDNSEAVKCEAGEYIRRSHDVIESDSESYDNGTWSEEDVEGVHEEEEDEWGFPTGQIDVRLYLDHVSSAIAQMREKQRRASDRRRRRRRSTRSSSMGGSHDDQKRSVSMAYDYKFMDESGDYAEECGLCRLPCDSHSCESPFGFVSMILPTAMLQKFEKGSTSATNLDENPGVFSRLPTLRVMQPGSSDKMRFQLADCVVWSCGHAIHHSCLKAYLMSLWQEKHGQSPLEMASSEDRLLSERDMEFMCPKCRRLSNCLVPSVSYGDLRKRALTSELSLKEFDPSEEEEEEKQDDGQDPLAFLQWLEAQMSYRDDSPEVKRRRSRTQSNLRLRRQSLSFASKSLFSPNTQSSDSSSFSPSTHKVTTLDINIEREISVFCHAIVLRCVRSQLHLSTLLSGSIQDEASVDSELQQLSSEYGAKTPAWRLLLHCFEVQLCVVAHEKTLLQAETVDPLQLRSMRLLAELVAASVCSSAPNPLEWTEGEASVDKHFENVITRLSELIFGQQVLFEDDEVWNIQYNQLQSGDACDAAIVGTPMLYHPSLLTCFAMRVMWRQSIATSNVDVAMEQLFTESFFLARIVFTAQILQAFVFLMVQSDSSIKDEKEEEASDTSPAEVRDFDQVETLRDAATWIFNLLARARLLDNTGRIPIRIWNAAAIEEQVSAMCLPLAQQMLLLMEVVLPIPHDFHNDSQDNNSDTLPDLYESCAVCDGLFVTTASDEPPTASHSLDICLRRLHLPPLRLFFHRQMFSSSQRALCQLWGAQLEAKAAVSRQQARSQVLVEGNGENISPLHRQVRLLSQHVSGASTSRLFIPLPRVYMDLFIRYNEKPLGFCRQCQQIPQHPGLCLFCGQVLCCFSACCEAKEGGGVGECTQHAQRCSLGTGAFLLLRACTVILFLGNERRCVWGSLYVDKNGEEDPYLRRGKTLYLDQSRCLALETLLVSHNFSQNTAILLNTSRRDGRRY